MSLPTRRTTALALGLGLALGAPCAAEAHVTLQPASAPAGGFTRLDVRVPNERNDRGTVKVDVKLPPGFLSVAYEPVPGWSVKITKEKLAKPIKVEGLDVSEQISRITWSGDGKEGVIAPGQFRDFGLSVALPKATPGSKLTFKALQTYLVRPALRARRAAAQRALRGRGAHPPPGPPGPAHPARSLRAAGPRRADDRALAARAHGVVGSRSAARDRSSRPDHNDPKDPMHRTHTVATAMAVAGIALAVPASSSAHAGIKSYSPKPTARRAASSAPTSSRSSRSPSVCPTATPATTSSSGRSRPTAAARRSAGPEHPTPTHPRRA